jgi:hypothetical protein
VGAGALPRSLTWGTQNFLEWNFSLAENFFGHGNFRAGIFLRCKEFFARGFSIGADVLLSYPAAQQIQSAAHVRGVSA